MENDVKSSKFFSTIKKTALAVNQASAGAGVSGLLGFVGLLLIASIFFFTENYFIAMLTISFGLLVYVTGYDLVKIILSSFTIFFSSKHLIPRASYLQETLTALKDALEFKRSKNGEITFGPVGENTIIQLPDNALVRDLQKLFEDEKQFEYVEYVAHSYYNECHELYVYSSDNLDFVANSMPLFGLIGTIVGLIAMFDSLGADVTVESLSPQLALALKTTLYGAIFSSIYKIIGSRFDQRLKALDYDFEAFSRALQVLIDNKVKIEVFK